MDRVNQQIFCELFILTIELARNTYMPMIVNAETEEDTKEKELDREEHDTETNQSIIKDLTLRLFYRIYHLMSKALITAIIIAFC